MYLLPSLPRAHLKFNRIVGGRSWNPRSHPVSRPGRTEFSDTWGSGRELLQFRTITMSCLSARTGHGFHWLHTRPKNPERRHGFSRVLLSAVESPHSPLSKKKHSLWTEFTLHESSASGLGTWHGRFVVNFIMIDPRFVVHGPEWRRLSTRTANQDGDVWNLMAVGGKLHDLKGI